MEDSQSSCTALILILMDFQDEGRGEEQFETIPSLLAAPCIRFRETKAICTMTARKSR